MPSFTAFPFRTPLAICYSEEGKGRDKKEKMSKRLKHPLLSRPSLNITAKHITLEVAT